MNERERENDRAVLPSTSSNQAGDRPPIPIELLMGSVDNSSDDELSIEPAVWSSDDEVMVSNAGKGDEDTEFRLHLSSSPGPDIDASHISPPVAIQPFLSPVPRPGRKRHFRHSFIEDLAVSPVPAAQPSDDVALYTRAQVEALLRVVACKACGADMAFTRHGRGFAQYDRWGCVSCDNLHSTEHKKIEKCYTPNLAMVYTSLVNDDGHVGFTRNCASLSLPSLSKSSYYKHMEILVTRMKTHNKELMAKVFANIRRYYQNDLDVLPDANNILAI